MRNQRNATARVWVTSPFDGSPSAVSFDENRNRFPLHILTDCVNAAVRHAYLHGQCHSFAAALASEANGTVKICAVEPPFGGVDVLHCYAETVNPETGETVWWDVEGPTTPEEATSKQFAGATNPTHVFTCTPSEALKLSSRVGYGTVTGEDPKEIETPLLPTCFTTAKRHAKIVLDAAGFTR